LKIGLVDLHYLDQPGVYVALSETLY